MSLTDLNGTAINNVAKKVTKLSDYNHNNLVGNRTN